MHICRCLIITFLELYLLILTTVITLVLSIKGFYPSFLNHLFLFSLFLLKLLLPLYALFAAIYLIKLRRRRRRLLTRVKFL